MGTIGAILAMAGVVAVVVGIAWLLLAFLTKRPLKRPTMLLGSGFTMLFIGSSMLPLAS